MSDIEVLGLPAEPQEDAWTVYGRTRTGLDDRGKVEVKGLHLDRATTLAQANAFVEQAIAAYQGGVDCVIVRLIGGRDSYGTRRVVRRVGEGRAWWE